MTYSTNANPIYFRATFMTQVTYDIIDQNGDLDSFTELDPFSEQLMDLVDSLTRFTIIRWTGQQLTTLVYNAYGNTTLIWLVLMCNGMVSRTELRNGMMLRLPYLSDINAWQVQNAINVASIGDVKLI